MNNFDEVPFLKETAQTASATNRSRMRGPRGAKNPFDFKESAKLYKILAREIPGRTLSLRDITLLGLGYDTSLRAEDLLGLRVSAVQDSFGRIRDVVYSEQGKSKNTVSHALIPTTRQRLKQWINQKELRQDDFLFSGQYEGTHLSRRRYADIVKAWAMKLKKPPELYATHSMRRTKPTDIYNQTKDIVVCQHQLGHASLACTHTYLNVTQQNVHRVTAKIRPF